MNEWQFRECRADILSPPLLSESPKTPTEISLPCLPLLLFFRREPWRFTPAIHAILCRPSLSSANRIEKLWFLLSEMEDGNGVEAELANGNAEKASDGNGLDEEEETIVQGVDDALQVNNTDEDQAKVRGLNSSQIKDGASPAVPDTKALNNTSEKTGSEQADVTKNTKAQGNRTSKDGASVIHQSRRSSLSQSLSFPAKVSVSRKSATSVKSDAKNPQTNGGSEVEYSTTNGRPPAKHPKSTAVPSMRSPLPMKSGSVDAAGNGDSFEVAQSHDGKIKPLRCTSVAKTDDDADSNTSTTPRETIHRKSSSTGFSFRLDERAEKRKEFFMKLEEKIQAKEVEKTNLQAKSKENQEAEIRQLRKSLTFKATPMPSFYQEPGPPKVELKKVPPTRAISPKLGRHKPSAAVADNSSEGVISRRSSRASLDPSKLNGGAGNSKEVSMSLKKPTQRSLTRLPSQKSADPRSEIKSLGLKPKVSGLKQKAEKTKTEESVEKPEEGSFPEAHVNVELDPSESTLQNVDATPKFTDSVVVSNEVPAVG